MPSGHALCGRQHHFWELFHGSSACNVCPACTHSVAGASACSEATTTQPPDIEGLMMDTGCTKVPQLPVYDTVVGDPPIYPAHAHGGGSENLWCVSNMQKRTYGEISGGLDRQRRCEVRQPRRRVVFIYFVFIAMRAQMKTSLTPEVIPNVHCASLPLKSNANNIMKIWV